MNSSLLRRFVRLIICIFLSSLVSLSAGTSDLLQPVAMWPAAQGGLYVLDRVGGLIYIPGDSGLDLKNSSRVAAFRTSWQAIDLAAVHIGSGDRVYIVLAQETIGMLMCYSDRKFERSWISKTLLTGIVPDPESHRLFLSAALTNEIYVFDWNDYGASPIKPFVVIHGSQTLGPLALDSHRHVLFAGDQRTGVIFAINIDSRSVSQLAQIQGQPNAMAFDAAHRTLYVADSVGRKVWAIRADGNIVKARIFSKSPDFRRPTAVAIDSRGTVWLGDQESQAIYRLSPKGEATAYRLFLQPRSSQN
jgi:DNA-binding beta-propeller fold protein YncE